MTDRRECVSRECIGISTRGSHAKLVRTLASGERQVLVVPLHRRPASGTVRAIYRQALRYVPEAEIRADFFVD